MGRKEIANPTEKQLKRRKAYHRAYMRKFFDRLAEREEVVFKDAIYDRH